MTQTATATRQPSLARWRWTITAAFALGGIAIAAWGPRLPAIKAELDISTGTIGLLLAGVTVGALAGMMTATAVLSRLGGPGSAGCGPSASPPASA